MIANKDTITDYIPQRQPFVLVGTLEYSDGEKTVSTFEISEDMIMVSGGFLSEGGLIENIAQTAAAGVGYLFHKENKPAPVGFIAAIKNLEIMKLPLVGSTIKTTVTIKNQVMDFSIINGQVFSGEEIIADCEMRIFVKKE